MSKDNQPDRCKLNEIIDHFVQLYKHECSHEMNTERKDTMATTCTIQPPRYMDVEHSETIRQNGNSIKTYKNTTSKHIMKKLLQWQEQDK